MKSSVENHLEAYLLADLENVEEPLQWWWSRRHVWPRLAQMALDFHSVPGKLFSMSSSTIVDVVL